MGLIISHLLLDFNDRIPYNPPILPGCIHTAFKLNLEDGSRIFRRNTGILRQLYNTQDHSLNAHRRENLKTYK
jgi:hypothetical protein